MTQRASTFTLWAAVAALLALPALAGAKDADDGRIPIVDPALLESMGFEPDTPNVYATPDAYAQMLMSPAELAAVSEHEAEEDEDVADGGLPAAFGATNETATLFGTDFAPLDADTDYILLGSGTQVTCNSGTPFFRGVFKGIPHGARASVRRIWFHDDHATENITAWLERTCFPFGSGGAPDITILRTNTSSGTPGWGRFGPGTALGEDIDSRSCVYAVRVRIGESNLNCTTGNQVGIAKASLTWRRQVSPAPATATFDDVPPGHLFFQQIEALAGSGITGGCDADSFCPNAPLTRGQMAAFLATALGLNWADPFFEP